MSCGVLQSIWETMCTQQKCVFIWSIQEEDGGGWWGFRFGWVECRAHAHYAWKSKSQLSQPTSSFSEQNLSMKEANKQKIQPNTGLSHQFLWPFLFVSVWVTLIGFWFCNRQDFDLEPCRMASPRKPYLCLDSQCLGSRLSRSFPQAGLGGQTQWPWPCSCAYQEEEDRPEPPLTLCVILG